LEASALTPHAGLTHARLPTPTALLKLRSDDQLVGLFRAGNEEAFRVIHDRYRARLFAYTRQMLPGARHDAEDALQDVFVRAYRALRSSDRELALRPWLYRVAHNRCVDELRRPPPPAPELLELVRPPDADPLAAAERRDDLRRLVLDLRRLPEQQRSALLMRELDGLTYLDIAQALDTSVPAVKSLLVRARMGLAQAGEARDTACTEIRGALTLAHDRGVRASGQARRHLRDCPDCRSYRVELRAVERRLAVFVPTLGPVAVAVKLLGFGGAASTGGGGALCTGGAAAGGAVCGGGAAGGAVVAAAATKVVAVVAVAAVATGGAVRVEHRLHHPAGAVAAAAAPAPPRARPVAVAAPTASVPVAVRSAVAPVARRPVARRAAPVAPTAQLPPRRRTLQVAVDSTTARSDAPVDPVARDPATADPVVVAAPGTTTDSVTGTVSADPGTAPTDSPAAPTDQGTNPTAAASETEPAASVPGANAATATATTPAAGDAEPTGGPVG
jgi:RNA polymerase sigma factor (sigma-70 family)